MTELVLKSGNSGNTALIDSKGRQKAFATAQPEEVTAALDEDTFVLGSGDITLTSANESGVLHVDNLDTVPWILTRLFFNTGHSFGMQG